MVATRRVRSEISAHTIEIVLRATVEQLQRNGPVDFRIEDLVRETGISVGGIYHHFGDRAGLLRAAYVKVVEDVQQNDAEVLRTLLDNCRTVDDVVEGLRRLTAATVGPERMDAREMRIEALALSRRDPALRERLVEIQKVAVEAHVAAFRELQRRGWMKSDVDPYLFFLSMSGNTLGTVQDRIGPGLLDPERWARHTIEMFTAFALRR